ncbi:MAG: hypothetical protein HGA85_01155 [Nanoarchaeota archaeon]|nr:hypothetical protein [Nanoarchaeota archaeon]
MFFNRVCALTYLKNKIVSTKKVEFYSLFYPEKDLFCVEYFFVGEKIDLKEYRFSQRHKMLFAMKSSISLLGDVIRRLAELKIASLSAGIVVIDGSLECKLPEEEEIMPKNIFGLSKTTELLTGNGKSVGIALSGSTDKKTWYYRFGNVCFIKLHERSSHIFRLDISDENSLNDLLSSLQQNAKDPVFLGYPYGLIQTDKMARVAKREQSSLRFELLCRVGEKNLKPFLASMDAHDILDSI